MPSVHSKVVQRRIGSVSNAAAAFNSSDREIPLVLVPDRPCCFACCVNIPDGVFVLWQRFTKNQGLKQPGLILCWPGFNRVSHIVTKTSSTYSAPVRNCPTRDNVMVSVEVSIMFQITEPEKFVYGIGASRFDEFLSAQTDESIRGLVNGVPAAQALDLRESSGAGMLNGLNAKVNKFGVVVLNVKITNVSLPKELEETLQKTTSYQTQMEKQEKEHQKDIRTILDDAFQVLSKIQRSDQRSVQDLMAAKQRAEINREKDTVSANTDVEVAVSHAEADAQTASTLANSEKDNAMKDGERKYTEEVERIKASTNADRIKYEQKLQNTVTRAKAEFEAVKAQAKAITTDANVEEKAVDLLKEQRQFELGSLRLQSMQSLAKNGKLIFSGKQGDQLLSMLNSPEVINMER